MCAGACNVISLTNSLNQLRTIREERVSQLWTGIPRRSLGANFSPKRQCLQLPKKLQACWTQSLTMLQVRLNSSRSDHVSCTNFLRKILASRADIYVLVMEMLPATDRRTDTNFEHCQTLE
jgi:hypothetical protein